MSVAAFEEDRHLLPVYPRQPLEPAAGSGVLLRTRDGREVVDLYGGHAVALLGYGHPGLLRALRDQAEALLFQSNAVALEVRGRAAGKLVSFAPGTLTRAFLVNSGAEANENALRLAFRRTRRNRVVALEGGFHGRTAAAGAVTHGAGKWYAFPRPPFEVTFVPADDTDALKAALDEDTAALILEPIQGMAGARDLDPDYLRACRRLTEETGTVLIFDEVQCGMGRTGHPFAADLYGVTPDVLTTAKGLAGGYPAGAALVTDRMAEGVGHGALGSTFGGGPMAAAMISAVLDAIESENLLENVRNLSARIRATCRVGPVTDIQGAGFLLGLRTSRPAREVIAALLDQGILTGSSTDPHVIRILAPLTLEEKHVTLLEDALKEIKP